MQNKFKRRFFKGLCLIIFALLLISALDMRLTVTPYTVRSEKIHTSVTIGVIADLHSCFYGEGQRVLLGAIHAAKPDVLLLTGDICDDHLPHDNTRALLQAVAAQYPCFYVTGNHEYRSGEVVEIKQMFRSYGVTVLAGEESSIEINGQSLSICGLDDPDVDRYPDSGLSWADELQALSKVEPKGSFTVLMSHRPERIATYLDYPLDLIVSGHTHGGQWRIQGLLDGLLAPHQGFFPRYAGGQYTFDKTTMIVSRGLARESTLVPRLFNRPELVIITLTPE